LAGLALLLAASVVLAAGVGAVHVPAREIIGMLLNHTGLIHLSPSWPRSDEIIILQIRLPRVLAAALVGTALSTAGVLFQGLFRNPLADPYVIGTSGGAAFGASLGVVIFSQFSFLGFGAIPTLAFAGAVTTMLVVFRLSRVGGRTPVVTLLLVGFAVSVILGYSVSLLLLVNERFELNTRLIYSWLLGGIWIEHWNQLGFIALIVCTGTVAAFTLARSLNGLALGEESAEHLGIAVERQKAAVIIVGSLLTAAAVSAGGLIGFVGLIVPHFLRLLFGPNHVRLLPLAALGGAAFLVIADLLARVVMPPNEVPVGILTALVGGPAFLLLLRRTKKEYRF
jgi:ABC-type Fe3+-siderophore transport system permease subunit